MLNTQSENINFFNIFLFMLCIKMLKCLNVKPSQLSGSFDVPSGCISPLYRTADWRTILRNVAGFCLNLQILPTNLNLRKEIVSLSFLWQIYVYQWKTFCTNLLGVVISLKIVIIVDTVRLNSWQENIDKNFNWSLWGVSQLGQAKLIDCNQIQGHVASQK